MSLIIPGGLSVSQYIYGDAFNARSEVRVATAAAGTLASDFENGDTVDGVVLATGDRILIKDQGTASENGVYIVEATGAPSRAPDYVSGSSVANRTVWVREGTANAGRQFVQRNNTTVGNALDFGIESDPSNTIYDNNFTAGNVLVAGGGNVLDEQGALQILDTNGNELLKFSATASAVNEVTITNAATSTAPIISATGETNTSLILQPNGTGSIVIDGGHSGLQFEGSTSGTLNFTVPATITSYTLTYPNAQGGASEVLINDGSGNLSWGAPTAASRVVYNFPFQIAATSSTYTTVGYISWDVSTYGAYANGRIIFEAVVDASRNLDIRLQDLTGAATIVESAGITSASDGFLTVTGFTNPVADARIALQVRKSANGGVDPLIYGIQVEWTTS